MIKESFPKVTLIENSENLGFGNANNLGAKRAKGEYLLFLNSDTLLMENSVQQLFNFYETKKENLKIGVLGCLLLNSKNEITNSGGVFPTSINILVGYFKYFFNFAQNNIEYTYLREKEFIKIDYVSGADLFIEKNIFYEVNGFYQGFFMYYEETDLQKRLHKSSFNNYIITTTKIKHLEGGSSFKKVGYSHCSRVRHKISQNLYLKRNDKYIYPIYKVLEILIGIAGIINPKHSIRENIDYLLSDLQKRNENYEIKCNNPGI
jgi:GT2 family glycosyltransferase